MGAAAEGVAAEAVVAGDDVARSAALCVGVVADGPPDERTTNSGVARGFSRAIAGGAGGAELAGGVSTRVTGWRRAVLNALTVRPTRRWWWFNANFGVLSVIWRSAVRERFARSLPEGAVLVHVRNVYLPSRRPYVAFIDQTLSHANRQWASWSAPTRASERWLSWVERRYYRGALLVMTAGRSARGSVIEDFGVPEERVVAIGGGVNFEELPVTPAREGAVRRILWVGLDWERKGGDVLREAFSLVREEFPDAVLTLVGKVPDGVEGPGVEVLGVVRDRARLAELYREADVFCLPARHEPYGLVVQEAMAFGLPVVVSSTGELATIIGQGECGEVVRDLRAEPLAEALSGLMRDGDGARAKGVAGRRRVERDLTWEAVGSRAVAAIRERRGAA